MKKLVLIILLSFILVFYIGCSAESNSEDTLQSKSFEGDFESNKSTADATESVSREATDQVNTASSTNNSVVKYDYGSRKIIKSGNISIQTLEFDKSLSLLKQKISQYDGYLENISVSGTGMNVNKLKRATVIARIPKIHYENLFNSASDIGNVSNQSSRAQDISDKYFDTEARLESLETKEDRLLVILNKTQDLDHIIELERELSDTRYQIENLTGTLNKYDSLVNYSTIKFNLIEVEEIVPNEPTKQETYFERLSFGFKEGYRDMVKSIQNLTLAFTRNFFNFIIVLILGLLGYKFKSKIVSTSKHIKDEVQDNKDKE